MKLLQVLLPALLAAAYGVCAAQSTADMADVQKSAQAVFQTALTSTWEVMWDQRGTPVRLTRWNKPIVFWIGGLDARKHHDLEARALREVADEAGVPITETQRRVDANLQIEFVRDRDMAENEPCATYGHWNDDSTVDHMEVKMRASQVWRCAYHESMHVMGLQGHPSGPTILSYFIDDETHLYPLDRAFLHVWYDPALKPGDSAFDVLPVMANEMACQMKDVPDVERMRDEFLLKTYYDMRDFAAGKGDVPEIVRKSGKADDAFIKEGREEMLQLLPASDHLELFRPLQCKSPLNAMSAESHTEHGEVAHAQGNGKSH